MSPWWLLLIVPASFAAGVFALYVVFAVVFAAAFDDACERR